MIPLPRNGKCLKCGSIVPIKYGDASSKAFKCDKCRIADLEQQRSTLQKVYEHAKGLCAGEDWNKGTHAHHHRVALRLAVKEAGEILEEREQ